MALPRINSLFGYDKAKIARATARKVDLLYNPDDFKVCMMAGIGMSTKAICEATGLSHCQVTYRITRANIKRAAYRNGESPVAKAMLRQTTEVAAPLIKKQLIARLKELNS
jgi:hypothetical protein